MESLSSPLYQSQLTCVWKLKPSSQADGIGRWYAALVALQEATRISSLKRSIWSLESSHELIWRRRLSCHWLAGAISFSVNEELASTSSVGTPIKDMHEISIS